MSVYRPKFRDPKTGEMREHAVWWFEFVLAGRRVRESSKSTRKTVAVEAEKNRRREMEKAYAGGGAPEPAAHRIRTVKSALEAYQKHYPVNHRKKSVDLVNERAPHLLRHLGSLLMPDLTEARIMGYITARRAEGVGNRTINIELSVLSRAMGSKFQTLWPKLRRLEENHDVGRALEPDEEQAILDQAAKNRSKLIHPFLFTLVWSGMRSDEARLMRWSQIDFAAAEIVVGQAKTRAGKGRRIPMSSGLRVVLEQHASWYSSRFGPVQPDWYVFPKCNRSAPIDPAQPIGSLKSAWESIRDAAGVKCRLHDLRHSFCTKLAEAGIPEMAMLDIMGHVSKEMLKRYSHIRAKARREAIDAVEARQLSVGVPKQSPKLDGLKPVKSVVTN